MNIIEAITDERLFKPFLQDSEGSIATWKPWLAALRVLYGLPIPSARRELVAQCTGRDITGLSETGYTSSLFLCGRRSGKSRIASVIGAYEAAMAGHQYKLAKGERGMVAVCSPTKCQSQNVTNYLRAIFDTDVLRSEVINETRNGFELKNGNMIEILAGDFRTVRGFTLIAAIIDEAAFFGVDEEVRIKSDSELIAAIEPGLATTGGRLIAITTPYARRGWCFQQFEKRSFSQTLVWHAPSRVMNSTLPQRVVDRALEEDYAKAKAEFLAEFRDDVGLFVPREVVMRLVAQGRTELMPAPGHKYFAFVDMASGGGGDDAAMAIGHREGRKVIVDVLRRFTPPFDPYVAAARLSVDLNRFNVRRVVGDHWSPGWTAGAFKHHGIRYKTADVPKAQLYADLLPRLHSGEIELPDDSVLIKQLCTLERRTRSGGRDIIDHPPDGHDDLANVVAGLSVVAGKLIPFVGAL